MMLTLFSVIGGVAGGLLDGRYFVFLSPIVPIAIFRTKALEGISSKTTLRATYLIATVVAGSLLFRMGIGLNKSKAGTYTPAQIAQEFVSHLPKPSAAQPSTINNIYNTKTLFTPPLPPLIELRKLLPVTNFLFNATATNTGGQMAKRATIVGDSLISPSAFRDPRDEDDLFKTLWSRQGSNEKAVYDMGVGDVNSMVVPISVQATPDELEDLRSERRILYLGVAGVYSDSRGKIYHFERCFVWHIGKLPGQCRTHNRTY